MILNLCVSEKTAVDISVELDNVLDLSANNFMIVNVDRTKKIVYIFHFVLFVTCTVYCSGFISANITRRKAIVHHYTLSWFMF